MTERALSPESPERIARENGQFLIPAEIIAGAFGLEAAAVPGMMREGRITSRSERGIDEDAGRWRLTLYCGGRAFRLTVDDEGRVLSRSRFAAAHRSPAD
ncbi:DUF6522 family protein [Histidinibacterium lentulum]|uniref:Uncharacterized protein n=1 Tax=Histidinibacterium lentulum TaxID=2480588 RepID=A0A3N2R910_9RHOB|nr:DUF6522 family protein [Histidinibacterium lentulum]ROU03925.1 hypothetical protein EAT49_00510 [Histidinibacterium lentulum]